MADTLGSLIDKLNTSDLKLWNSQEILYEIRRMTFDEFKDKYFSSEQGAVILWDILKKVCDLNIQRNQLIDEIDSKVIEMIKDALSGEELDNGKHIQRKHKTY
jgi:predicted nucleic acid-binding protein